EVPLQNVEVTVTGTLRESFQTPTPPPPILPAAPHGLRTRFESIATNATVRATIHPQPAESDRRADRRSIGLVDSTDNFAVRNHVEIIVVPLAGWPTISAARFRSRVVFFHRRAASLLRSQQPQFFGLTPHFLDRAGPTGLTGSVTKVT